MITVRVICVGTLKEGCYFPQERSPAYPLFRKEKVQLCMRGRGCDARAACEEYVKRLGAFCRIEVMELSEHRLPENPSPAQIVQGLDAEGQAILQRCTCHAPASAI